MMNWSKNYFIIAFSGLFFSLSSCQSTSFFKARRACEKVSVKIIDANNQIKYLDNHICKCDYYSNNIVVRVSKSNKHNKPNSREYYGEDLFSIGFLSSHGKNGIWTVYCYDVKISEELWNDNHLTWVKIYNIEGVVVSTINFGPKEEDF